MLREINTINNKYTKSFCMVNNSIIVGLDYNLRYGVLAFLLFIVFIYS